MLLVHLLLFLASSALGHGSLRWPPARSLMGHDPSFSRCPGLRTNRERQQMWCGGINTQFTRHQGKCGICGDPLDEPHHEAGGRAAKGYIAQSYLPGQVIDVFIDIPINHVGFMTFDLCTENRKSDSPPQSCFDKNPLRVSPYGKPGGGERPYVYYVHENDRLVRLEVELPRDITCNCCLLQWTWTGGDQKGKGAQNAYFHTTDCDETRGRRKGCGPQETYKNCADICIGFDCPTARCEKCASWA